VVVAVSDDLGDNGGSRWRMTAGDNVGDDVGDDVGNGDDGGNDIGNDTNEGDGGDTGREEGGAPGGGYGGGGGGGSGGGGDCVGGGCILLGSFPFYCEDNFVWYFYVWGELARSHLPSHSCHA
jgi:hypothetical protein